MALCGVIALAQCTSDPGTAQSGQMIWNTTTNDVKIYDGDCNNAWFIWQPAQPPDNALIQISGTTYATGGNIVCCGNNYVCHLFYTTGTLNWTLPNFQIDNIYVFGTGGGGGGGGNVGAGGGGAVPSILGVAPGLAFCWVSKGCCSPCDWRGPYCWDTTNWDNPSVGPSMNVTIGGGGAGGAANVNGTDGGTSSVCIIHSSAPGACAAGGSTDPNNALIRCGGSISSGCLPGEAAILRAWSGGGGAGGPTIRMPRNGGGATCCPSPSPSRGIPGYHPNGGAGSGFNQPGQKRTSGGGGNWGADQGARSCILLEGGAGNVTTSPLSYLLGGSGSCGYKPPHTPWICAGGGGAGSSHMGNTICDGGAPAACNDAVRTCTNNSGSGGCGGTGDFPQEPGTRHGGHACTISAPYPTNGGWVGGGGGGSGYNGSGGNGSSGMIIIKYPCVFT